jgi:hypothetical protein
MGAWDICKSDITEQVLLLNGKEITGHLNSLTHCPGGIKCLGIVETCVSLGLHPHILSLSIHYPTLVLRISFMHTRTHLFSQLGLTQLMYPSVHPSMSHWCLLVHFSHTIPFYLTWLHYCVHAIALCVYMTSHYIFSCL